MEGNILKYMLKFFGKNGLCNATHTKKNFHEWLV